MSGSQSPVPGSKPEKAMSSRLLTMKFMQRAAASSSSSPTTPKVTTPGARPPFTPNQRAPTLSSQKSTLGDTEIHLNSSSKRQKLSDGTSTYPSPPNPQISALEAAIEAVERPRAEALARQAKEAGETEWVLNFADSEEGFGNILNESVNGIEKVNGPVFLSCGWGGIDSELDEGLGMGKRTSVEDNDEEEEQVVGRKAFGGFKRKTTNEAHCDSDSDSDSSSSSKSESRSLVKEDEDSDDPTTSLIRQARLEAAAKAKASRRAKKGAEKAESVKLAQQRNGKTVNLNRLTSISGGGGSQGKCFRCGATDHRIQRCPVIAMERKVRLARS